MAVMVTDLLAARASFDALPEDGVRREFIDGRIIVSPSPLVLHQTVVGGLYRALYGGRPDRAWQVLTGPIDVFLGPDVLVPDLVVVRRGATERDGIHVAPELVVEVRSPSTGRRDETVKLAIYERAGVACYWLVDPDVPSLTVLELRDGRFVQTAHAVGDEWITVAAPYPLELNPAQLAQD